MATIHLDPGDNYVEQTNILTRQPLFAAIRWGAVLAGVAVGISVQLVLTLLGIAAGLATIDVTSGETVGMGPLIWAGISMLIAAFVGAYVAARMSGLKRKVDGILHGVVSWAVTTLLFVVLATSAGGSLMSGVLNNLNLGNGVATSEEATADRAVGVGSATAWTVFLTVALSLALGVGGGALGSTGARRRTWARTEIPPGTPDTIRTETPPRTPASRI